MLKKYWGYTRKNKIRNNEIRLMISVAFIDEKMRENCLRQISHVQWKVINALVRNIELIQVEEKKKKKKLKEILK